MAAREREYDDEDDDRPRPKRRSPDEFEEGEPRPRKRRPSDEFEEEDDRPRRRSREEEDEDEYDDRPRRRRRRAPVGPSGIVTLLAVINFVFGGFAFLGGLVVMFAGSWFMGMMGAAAADPGFQGQGPGGQRAAAQVQGIMGMGMAFFVIVGVVVLVVAVLYILTGYGLQQRRQWGRILAIVLGVLNGLGAACGLLSLPGSLFSIIINGAYAGLTLGVLFQPQYAEEFQ
jgi:hypothetical protein